VFIISVIISSKNVASCSFYIKCSMCLPWTTHLLKCVVTKSSCF